MASSPSNTSIDLEVRRAVVRGTESLCNEALRLILDTPKTGRVYRRRSIEHQASAPGEPPASDTGRLVQSVTTDYGDGGYAGTVTFRTAYAAALEYGTERMEPRPYARPAVANKRREIIDDLVASVGRGARAEARGGM